MEQGQTITITRHGRPGARLVPVSGPRRSVDEAIAALREFRKGNRLDGLTVRELIDEGREGRSEKSSDPRQLLSQKLGVELTVPEHPQIVGALGAALVARGR